MSFLPTQPYKGSRDFYPQDKAIQNWIFEKIRAVVRGYGYQEYDGPMLESFDLYAAKSGSELVNQQLYSLVDRGDRKVAIRPEMTPTLARMVAAKVQELPKPVRWFSIPNLWRYERPQKGRLREHWQLNVDVLGGEAELADFEVLRLACDIFRSFGGEKFLRIRVNNRQLVNYFFGKVLALEAPAALGLSKLVDAKDKMPPDVFAKALDDLGLVAEQKTALDFFFKASLEELAKRFSSFPGLQELLSLKALLKDAGLEETVVFDAGIMRGLDYYTGTVFEAFDVSPENPRALFGGGRYDNLIGLFGKQQLSGMGFGMGDVILRSFLETHKLLPAIDAAPDVFVSHPAREYFSLSMQVSEQLRSSGLSVAQALDSEGFSTQLKTASKLGVRFCVLLGEAELRQGQVVVKDLRSGEQKTLPRTDLSDFIRSAKLQS